MLIEPRVFRDDRGWFMETFNANVFREHGLPLEFAQDNHSSSRAGVIRGLHYQLDPAQGKLVRCVRGAIFDVAVDIRRASSQFGKWVGLDLSEENQLMLWIPPGFAHGFSVLSDEADVVYKCTTLWSPAGDRTIVWNDPDLGIDWRVATPIVSPKDASGPRLRDAELFES
ncbi:MAG TPA: dTDP-4-dehydrorhamnose 3,5-epimerase [Thermoanaerobaculia bacterium]|nr:dTDP-4-dehydrorhamnose 3,5-epimerase [Thermoanaerobaculia bacterium]